jgi:hypothetical protein
MKNNRRKYIKIIFITLLLFVFVISGCSKKVEVSEEFDYDGELKGNLQMARVLYIKMES